MEERSKLLKQMLAFIHSYNRACFHPKNRVRLKNYRRAKHIIDRLVDMYGYVPLPPEWVEEGTSTREFFIKNYT